MWDFIFCLLRLFTYFWLINKKISQLYVFFSRRDSSNLVVYCVKLLGWSGRGGKHKSLKKGGIGVYFPEQSPQDVPQYAIFSCWV